ncbi:MAG: hypothetical protein KDA91_19685, partial [Planctomycetaceae bacterium]|nr:hypothetical protein [Planctomycetaceae bacterium]
ISTAVQEKLLDESQMVRTLAIANGIRMLSDSMTEGVMKVIMSLQGNELGFRTDKDDRGGYDMETVRQCALRALLHGAHLIENEFNIIAGRMYLTQSYFIRRCRQWPGVNDVQITLDAPDGEGVPRDKNLEFRLGGEASCTIDGRQIIVEARLRDNVDSRIVVRAFNNATALDGAMGKAKKRLAQRLFERLSGIVVDDENDGGATVTVKAPSRIEEQAASSSTNEPEVAEGEPEFVTAWRNEFRGCPPEVSPVCKKILEAWKSRDQKQLDAAHEESKSIPDGLKQRTKWVDRLRIFAEAVIDDWSKNPE